MPRPAQGCRPAQVDDKTVIAPDLSLRGGRRPTWRPERAARGSALGVQSREGSHDFADSLPVIRLGTARLPRRFAPRNDKLGGHCFLTLARTSRRCSTGPGCPLPYKARPEACLLFILHFSVFSIHFFTYAPLQRRVHVSPETKSPPVFPEGIAFYRGMAGTASISCRRFESEMSFRGHTAAQRPQETHLE